MQRGGAQRMFKIATAGSVAMAWAGVMGAFVLIVG